MVDDGSRDFEEREEVEGDISGVSELEEDDRRREANRQEQGVRKPHRRRDRRLLCPLQDPLRRRARQGLPARFLADRESLCVIVFCNITQIGNVVLSGETLTEKSAVFVCVDEIYIGYVLQGNSL